MRANDARERRGHRFLADAEMHGTAHLVRRMIFRHEHLLDAANEVHHPVELKARWRSTAHDRKVPRPVIMRKHMYILENGGRKCTADHFRSFAD